MPLWRRGAAAADVSVSERHLAFATFQQKATELAKARLVGAAPCSHPDCTTQTAASCAYVDRRGQRCPTAWCLEHQYVVGGEPYCPQHAKTLDAVGVDTPVAARPDWDNPAPALVAWMFRDLHDRVVELLDTAADYAAGEHMLVDENARSLRSDTGRRWLQGWKLQDATGALSVTVAVDEASPEAVTIHVGSHALIQETPPWLSQNAPASEEEAQFRVDFYERVYREISHALSAERVIDPRVGRGTTAMAGGSAF